MKQNLGIFAIIFGALMLIISYISETLVDINWYNVSALIIIIAGIVAHIMLNKRA